MLHGSFLFLRDECLCAGRLRIRYDTNMQLIETDSLSNNVLGVSCFNMRYGYVIKLALLNNDNEIILKEYNLPTIDPEDVLI